MGGLPAGSGEACDRQPAPLGKKAVARANRLFERRACEIRLRAERKAGQLLAKQVKRGGSKSRDTTLKPNGISKDQSSRWQKLGAVPQADERSYSPRA
jgi:hypothetical protein